MNYDERKISINGIPIKEICCDDFTHVFIGEKLVTCSYEEAIKLVRSYFENGIGK